MTEAEGSPATTAKERLTQFLKDGKDWERKATNIPGIFLFKLPGLRGRGSPLVAIEINPVDSSGSANKEERYCHKVRFGIGRNKSSSHESKNSSAS